MLVLDQTSVPGTDDWWLVQLAADFGDDLPRLWSLQSYADGTNSLPDEVDASMQDAYRRFIRMSRLNMADLIVSTKVSRMRPQGFRTAAPGDQDGDAAAWATWKRSGMKIGSRDFFTDAGVLGSAYLTTTGPQVPSSSAEPIIIPSNGFSTVTRQYVLQPWLTEAALQVGYDAVNGVELLTLFRPGYMRTAMRSAKKSSIPSTGRRWAPGRGWDWVSDPIPLGYTNQVPVYKYSGPGGKGMFEKHLDSLDRLTNRIRDGLTITAMQAFKQRALKGDLPKYYPEGSEFAGQEVPYDEIFATGPAALWRLPAGVDIWESTVTDITPILTATKDDTKNLSAATSTPMYVLAPDAVNASNGSSEQAAEAFETSVEEWIARADMPIALSLATAFLGQADITRAAVGDIETIWAPVTRTSLNEKASAAAQAKASGQSQAFINESIWGMSPEQLAQERQNRTDEAFETPAVPA